MTRILAPFFILIILFLMPLQALAQEINASVEFAAHANEILAAIHFDIPDGYHAYANDEKESGLPTRLNFSLDNRVSVPVLYPRGNSAPDIFDPHKKVNIYKGNIVLLTVLPEDAPGQDYNAALEMLLCSSRHCLPFTKTFSGNVPAQVPPLADVPWKNQAEALLAGAGDSSGTLTLEEGQVPPPVNTNYDNDGQKYDSGNETALIAGSQKMDAPEDFDLQLKPRFAAADPEMYGLGKALILGIIAGLLLNVMPCVLPVLAIKASGLMLSGNLKDRTRLHNFRQHNLFFAGGILTFFIFLAFLLGAADLMWGQLYQSQAVILAMLMLVFLMGLSMLGVFTLPVFDLKIGENSRSAKFKSFCTGFASTFLATPCSGPLLGGVLAWAFTRPMPILVTVFLAVGLGMSLPYIAFSIWPAMAAILPRPGKWMNVFEHILGFLLLATALYLLSILPAEKHMQILAVLLGASACAWLWGRFCGLSAPVMRRRIIGLAGLLFVGISIFQILQPQNPGPQWQEFSAQEFADDLGKKNMLVEFTADWCPNCKFLEATVLSDRNLRDWRKKYGLELVRVDLTRPDAYAERLLQMLGSRSIPLTAIFPSGANSSRPMVLRDLYGEKTLDKALKKSLGNS